MIFRENTNYTVVDGIKIYDGTTVSSNYIYK